MRELPDQLGRQVTDLARTRSRESVIDWRIPTDRQRVRTPAHRRGIRPTRHVRPRCMNAARELVIAAPVLPGWTSFPMPWTPQSFVRRSQSPWRALPRHFALKLRLRTASRLQMSKLLDALEKAIELAHEALRRQSPRSSPLTQQALVTENCHTHFWGQ